MIISGSIIEQNYAEYTVIGDYIEAGTFFVLGALTANPSIKIE